MPPFTGKSTLDQVKIWLDLNSEWGAFCPCCAQMVKVYTRKLNSAQARDLIWLVRMSTASLNNGWIDISGAPKSLHRSRELAKLVHWDLIEMHAGASNKGARTSGVWRPLAKGVQFAQGHLTVPSHVRLYNGTLLGFTGSPINIVQALGNHFDFDELWAAR